MTARFCLTPACGNLATYRGRCATHTTQRNRETASVNKSFYGTKRWRITRRHKLFLTPLCEWDGCEQLATDVHHRTALQAGGAPYALDNLESLCKSHHSQHTRREQLDGVIGRKGEGPFRDLGRESGEERRVVTLAQLFTKHFPPRLPRRGGEGRRRDLARQQERRVVTRPLLTGDFGLRESGGAKERRVVTALRLVAA